MLDQIIKNLENVLKESDIVCQENFIKWAFETKEKLNEYKKRVDVSSLMKNDVWKYYDMLFAFCGGKTWYKILNENSGKYLEAQIIKICKKNIDARNKNIAKKLSKFEITEIQSEEFSKTEDDFHGIFVVNTDKGIKNISIRTIYAGGYNIRCGHMRTLIKVS